MDKRKYKPLLIVHTISDVITRTNSIFGHHFAKRSHKGLLKLETYNHKSLSKSNTK